MSEYVENINQEEEGISLQDLFKVVWNNKVLIIFVTFWVVVFGFVYTFVMVTPQYTSRASVKVEVTVDEEVSSLQQSLYVADRIIATYEEYLISSTVLDSVKADIPAIANMSNASLANSITLSRPTDAFIFYLSVENESPALAQEIVNTLVENSIALANDDAGDGANAFLYLEDRFTPLDTGTLPVAPSSPNNVLNIVISVILGGILSLGIVFVREFFNNKFKTKEDVEKYLGVKVLATVPGTVKERKVVE